MVATLHDINLFLDMRLLQLALDETPQPHYLPVTCVLLLSHCRKELIAQYSRLSEEAARRERRAMWRVQRMRLDDARAQFFMHDSQQTQVCTEST